MSFWSVFFGKALKKAISRQKPHFGYLKNIDKTNICVSIVIKAYAEKKFQQKIIDLKKACL